MSKTMGMYSAIVGGVMSASHLNKWAAPGQGRHSRQPGPPTRYLSHDEMDRQTLDMWGYPPSEHNLRVMRLPRSRSVRGLLVRTEVAA